MTSIQQKPRKCNPPMLLTFLLALTCLLFPGWRVQAQPRPRPGRRQYAPRTFEAALSLSLQYGYNSVRWEAVNG